VRCLVGKREGERVRDRKSEGDGEKNWNRAGDSDIWGNGQTGAIGVRRRLFLKKIVRRKWVERKRESKTERMKGGVGKKVQTAHNLDRRMQG